MVPSVLIVCLNLNNGHLLGDSASGMQVNSGGTWSPLRYKLKNRHEILQIFILSGRNLTLSIYKSKGLVINVGSGKIGSVAFLSKGTQGRSFGGLDGFASVWEFGK